MGFFNWLFGPPDGIHIKKYESGNIHWRCNILDGKRHGMATFWIDQKEAVNRGWVILEATFSDGSLQGPARIFTHYERDAGEIVFDGGFWSINYLDGEEHGYAAKYSASRPLPISSDDGIDWGTISDLGIDTAPPTYRLLLAEGSYISGRRIGKWSYFKDENTRPELCGYLLTGGLIGGARYGEVLLQAARGAGLAVDQNLKSMEFRASGPSIASHDYGEEGVTWEEADRRLQEEIESRAEGAQWFGGSGDPWYDPAAYE